MTDLVPIGTAEQIVGATRHDWLHLARAISRERTVYILHPVACKEAHADLRECLFSLALDRGIDEAVWADWQDRPVQVGIQSERLVPIGAAS